MTLKNLHKIKSRMTREIQNLNKILLLAQNAFLLLDVALISFLKILVTAKLIYLYIYKKFNIKIQTKNLLAYNI